MNPGDYVVLKYRPVTGKGQVEKISGGMIVVRLENGMRLHAFESDLLPDLKPDLNYGISGGMGRQ